MKISLGAILGTVAVLVAFIAIYATSFARSGATMFDVLGLVRILGIWGMLAGAPLAIGGLLVLLYLLVRGVTNSAGAPVEASEEPVDDGVDPDSHAARVLRAKARRVRIMGPLFRTMGSVLVLVVLVVVVRHGCSGAIDYMNTASYIKDKVDNNGWTQDMITFYRKTGRDPRVLGDGSDSVFAAWMVAGGKWNADGVRFWREWLNYPPKYGWTKDAWWGEVDRQRLEKKNAWH